MPTETELLARIKAVRQPSESPEGSPDEAKAVDVSVETPDVVDELQAEEKEPESQPDESLTDTEELEDTTEAVDNEEESLCIELDGKEITLDEIRELQRGSLRESDYTQKTQRLAEDRQAVDAQREKQTELLGDLQSHIDLMSTALDSEFEGVNWDELRDLDTSEYLKLKEQKESRQGELDSAKAKQKELLDLKKVEKQTKGNQELFDLNPSWVKDGAKTQTCTDDQELLVAYVKDKQFTQEEIDVALSSGKLMQAMIDSAKLQATIAKAPSLVKKVKQAPVVVKGKRPTVTTINRQIQEAQAKLKQTGKLEDAVVLRKLKRQLER